MEVDESIIRPVTHPYRPEPGLIILRGNLGPGWRDRQTLRRSQRPAEI
jgi:hypothetical protein